VIGNELAVEQLEAADFQACHEVRQGNLGGVALAAEHTLAEKSAAKPHAIKAADQFPILPRFDRVRMAAPM
jgi:hypothetical protein